MVLPLPKNDDGKQVVTTTGEEVGDLHLVALAANDLNCLVGVVAVVQLCGFKPTLKVSCLY